MNKCPWCGETPVIKEKGENGEMKLFVCPPGSKCHGSNLFVASFGSTEDAIKAWNGMLIENDLKQVFLAGMLENLFRSLSVAIPMATITQTIKENE